MAKRLIWAGLLAALVVAPRAASLMISAGNFTPSFSASGRLSQTVFSETFSMGIAAGLSPSFNAERFADLYLFLADRRIPEHCSMDELIDTFHAARHYFLNMPETSVELVSENSPKSSPTML